MPDFETYICTQNELPSVSDEMVGVHKNQVIGCDDSSVPRRDPWWRAIGRLVDIDNFPFRLSTRPCC